MTKRQKLLNLNKLSFKEYMIGTNKIVQDKFYQNKRFYINVRSCKKKEIIEEELHSYYFTNTKKYFLLKENPICYIRNSMFSSCLKNLKNGKYFPEITLDLHGLTKNQAKKELGRLFFICQKEKFSCVSIIHGHGKNILKLNIPFWLSQHPNVIAFHEAPRKFGKNIAILVLLEVI
ncbi:MAG: endonuclease SmrB [Buchnera aphidicola (Tetraneura akinire)]